MNFYTMIQYDTFTCAQKLMSRPA